MVNYSELYCIALDTDAPDIPPPSYDEATEEEDGDAATTTI